MNKSKIYNNRYFIFFNIIIYIFLLIGNSIYLTISGYGLFPYRIIIIVSLFIYLFYFSLSKKNIIIKPIEIYNYLFFIVVFILYSLISVFWIDDIMYYFRYNYYLLLFLYIFLNFIIFCNSTKRLFFLLDLWLIIFHIQMIFSIFELFFSFHTLNSRYVGTNLSIPTGFFGNENEFAVFIVMSIPIMINRFIYYIGIQKSDHKKYFLVATFYFILIYSIFVIYQTSSRASILSLLILLSCHYYSKLKNYILFLTFLTLIFILFNIDLLNKFDQSIIVRINMMYYSIMALVDTNLFGVGAGNMISYVTNHNLLETYGIKATHNWFFEFLGNYGLLIFITYIIFTVSIFYNLYKIYLNSFTNVFKYLSLCLFYVNLIFLFSCITLSSAYSYIPYWLLLSLSITFINIYRNEEKIF